MVGVENEDDDEVDDDSLGKPFDVLDEGDFVVDDPSAEPEVDLDPFEVDVAVFDDDSASEVDLFKEGRERAIFVGK